MDQMLRFSIPERNVRGRTVRLQNVFAEISATHNYPPAIATVLGEALCLASLIGSLLKDANGQLTMQAQTENGIIDLLVCDYKDSAIRGYVKFDADRLKAEDDGKMGLSDLFGKGYLAITFDQKVEANKTGEGERYQGIVPLEGNSLSDAVQSYFFQSEQIPTFIRVAVDYSAAVPVVGGFLAQHLPEGEEGRERLHVQDDHPDWEHVQAFVETISADELTDLSLTPEQLLWRLFHEEKAIRTENGSAVVKGCRCNMVHIRDVLGRFPSDERREMADEKGDIIVDCSFCSEKFAVPAVSFEN